MPSPNRCENLGRFEIKGGFGAAFSPFALPHARPLHRMPGRPGPDATAAAGRSDHAAADVGDVEIGAEPVDLDFGLVASGAALGDHGAHAVGAHVAERHRRRPFAGHGGLSRADARNAKSAPPARGAAGRCDARFAPLFRSPERNNGARDSAASALLNPHAIRQHAVDPFMHGAEVAFELAVYAVYPALRGVFPTVPLLLR